MWNIIVSDWIESNCWPFNHRRASEICLFRKVLKRHAALNISLKVCFEKLSVCATLANTGREDLSTTVYMKQNGADLKPGVEHRQWTWGQYSAIIRTCFRHHMHHKKSYLQLHPVNYLVLSHFILLLFRLEEEEKKTSEESLGNSLG